jgi:hypothetical protein
MKKLILVASLCVAAAVVAPIASASASFVGTCPLKGTATFGGKLSNTTPKNTEFHFVSEGETECTGNPTNAKLNKAKVDGKGELSCSVSENVVSVTGSVSGSGSIEINKKLDNFEEFKFVAAAGVVDFAARGEKSRRKSAWRRPRRVPDGSVRR